MKPTLLVLAAGMGSRYGSLKQMDGIGPNNEAIIDYSVYDAIRAGFGKVVFVIRHSFENEFKAIFNAERFRNAIDVNYVFQELDSLPLGFNVPSWREKPWGTNHAILMAVNSINEPFATINADDFYGQDAFMVMGRYLRDLEGKENLYCMVSYPIMNTLSEYGAVSRGVCAVDRDDFLQSIEEYTQIVKEGDAIIDTSRNRTIDPLTPVSMNLFGFTPDYFKYSTSLFVDFLKVNGNDLKAEFYLPATVNYLINQNQIKVKVLTSDSQWFGVTYKEDRQKAIEKIKTLIDKGNYPLKLWKDKI